MEERSSIKNNYVLILIGILVLSGLYLISLYSYILFHSLAELFSIAVAWGVFMLAWNSRRYSDNNYLLFISIAFLFVGGIDLLHTLAYKGIGVFQGYDSNLPTQLWISARYLQGISFLIAIFFVSRKFRTSVVLILYIVAVSFLLASIFYWKVLPDCYIEGTGLTPFKKVSEYIISFSLLVSIVLLIGRKDLFDKEVLRLLILSLAVSMASELTFTFYINVYGLSNLLGHYLKIFSFYLIYKAIIVTGTVRPFDLVFRDLRQREEELRESEERYRSYIEVTGQLGWTTNAEGKAVEDLPSWRRYTGQTYDEIKGWGWAKALHPDDLEHASQTWRKAVSAKSTYEVEYRIRRHDGIYRHFLARGIPVLKEDGSMQEWVGTCIDITDRKKSEEKIEHLASFPQLNPNPVIEIDLQGKVTFFNAATEEILNNLGMKEDPNIFLPGDLYDILNALGRGDETQFFYREIKIKDKVFAENIYVTKKLNVVRIYTTDITEHKQAEESLRASEERLRYHVENSPLAVVEWDTDFIVTRWRGEAENIFGWSAAETVGKPIMDLHMIFEEDIPIVQKTMEKLTDGVSRHVVSTNRNYTKDGRVIHCTWYNTVLQDSAGKMKSVMSQVLDITKRKKAEEETLRLLHIIQEDKDRLLALINSINDEIWFADSNKKFTLANPSALREFGFSAAGGIDVEKLAASLEVYRPDGSPRPVEEAPPLRALHGEVITNMEEIIRTPVTGELRYRQVSSAPVRDASGNIIGSVSVVRDITERKQAEEELWQHRNRLEELVNKRTDELIKINEELEVEISERKLMEEKLKESREQLRNLTAYLQTVREEERKYISREIHDELGQALTALKMEMSWLGQKYRDHEPLFEKVRSMINLIDSTIQTVKRISSELRPSLLDDLGLPEAVEWQTREFQDRTGISCELKINPDNIVLDKDRSIAIFRIFQEALTNVARHSKAKKAKVCLEKKDSEIVLNIEDTGKGIKEKEISDPQSFGLIGIR